jgi:hypothetical protein
LIQNEVDISIYNIDKPGINVFLLPELFVSMMGVKCHCGVIAGTI